MDIEDRFYKTLRIKYNDNGASYEKFYRVFGRTLIRQIKAAAYGEKNTGVENVITFDLALENQLKTISFSALLMEMNLCNRFHELSGNTDEERYQSFVDDCLLNEGWLKEFFSENPLIHQYLFQTMQNTSDSVMELLQRFEKDKDLLNKKFFVDNPCSAISRISSAGSDVHKKGRRVFILELDNKEKIVYKPRSLAIDCAYQNIVSWIAEEIGVSYRWNQTWDLGDYGWSEWVSAETCESREQLERYYLRNGILLAVSYLLGSGDIHYENLIARGETPIIIDLEMGAGKRRGKNAAADAAEMLYQDSVLRTGLLPMIAWNENGEGVNVGAINAAGGDLVPINVPVIVQAGTINMHIEYRCPVMKEAKNLATLRGQFLEPYQFLSQMENGFERAYRFIMEHKQEVLRRVNELEKTPVRFLISNTQLYSMILSASYLPKYMRSEACRSEALAQIKGGRDQSERNEWIAQQEIEEMSGGDIPYFWCYAGERDLHSGNGESYQNYFSQSIIEEITVRLDRMNDNNMRQQQRLIRASLLIGEKKDNRGIKAKQSLETNMRYQNEKSGEKIAKTIGDLLIDQAVWGEEKESVSWIGMILAGFRERGYLIKPMGPYLYDGWAGVLLFMTALAAKTGEKRFSEMAELLKKQVFAHTDHLVSASDFEHRSVGAYTGEASIAYAYQLLYAMEKDKQYLDYMEKQCAVLPQICEHDRNYDVLGGNAGAILVLLNAYELTGKEVCLEGAKQAADYLIKAATSYEWGGWGWIVPSVDKALTGFAHGASGIMLALARLSHICGEQKYEDAAYKAFLFEQYYYEEEKLDWVDLRFGKEYEKQLYRGTAWCHGWGGIMTASNEVKNYVKGEWKQELERISVKVCPKVRYQKNEDSYSLCHGKLGNVALLYCMGEKEMAVQRYQEILCEVEECGGALQSRLGQQECENYGLMGGITGIGYACLCGPEKITALLTCGMEENDCENYLQSKSGH